jgi:hypothetical protein
MIVFRLCTAKKRRARPGGDEVVGDGGDGKMIVMMWRCGGGEVEDAIGR